jgi:hypothetical protein
MEETIPWGDGIVELALFEKGKRPNSMSSISKQNSGKVDLLKLSLVLPQDVADISPAGSIRGGRGFGKFRSGRSHFSTDISTDNSSSFLWKRC